MTNESALSLELNEQLKGILVVEDEVMTRFTLAEWFRMEGYRVYEAADAGDAVVVLSSPISIDLVITDVDMPGPMNGLDLLDYINANAPHIQVIVATGRDVNIAERGATVFVKPYLLPRMSAQVLAMLNGSDSETSHE
jgi:two-component system, response regulator PdtaR